MTILDHMYKQSLKVTFLPEANFHDNIDDDPSDKNDETDDTTEYQLKGGIKLVKRKKAKIIRSVRCNKENDPENY